MYRDSYNLHIMISIHALREEGDLCTNFSIRNSKISIHALREEGDAWRCLPYTPQAQFLSTPSARRATRVDCVDLVAVPDFYPRPPRGGRLLAMLDKIYHAVISIHALREEGDQNRTKDQKYQS